MAKNNNLTDFLTDVANAIRDKKGTSELIDPQNFSDEIASISSGGGAIIRTAELPNVTLTLSQNGTDIESKTTPDTTGGIVDFNVNATGTYTITAVSGGVTTWTRNVTVDELSTITICKAGTLNSYPESYLHSACQGGYFSIMFSLKDEYTLVAPNSALHNNKFFVEEIEKTQDNKEIVHFRSVNYYNGAYYRINPRISFLTSATATAWTTNYRSTGGFKYSEMIQKFMKQGDTVYSQATGILPSDYSGTLATGVKFNELKYTNGNDCPIYDYDCTTDTMTLLATAYIGAPSQTHTMFIKGYFKNVGAIDQTTFENGVYYTYNGQYYVYTKETTYSSGTTYYGLYETLQEDGFFTDALFKTDFSGYLVKFAEKASAGGYQTTTVSEYQVYCDIPAVEELIGLNRNMTLVNGVNAGNACSFAIAGEGTMKNVYDFKHLALATVYWTRSTMSESGLSQYFIRLMGQGYPSSKEVYENERVRIGFRIN